LSDPKASEFPSGEIVRTFGLLYEAKKLEKILVSTLWHKFFLKNSKLTYYNNVHASMNQQISSNATENYQSS